MLELCQALGEGEEVFYKGQHREDAFLIFRKYLWEINLGALDCKEVLYIGITV